jgi:hypothetical protein
MKTPAQNWFVPPPLRLPSGGDDAFVGGFRVSTKIPRSATWAKNVELKR